MMMNNKGFSFTEVVMSGAILGAVVLGFMATTQQQNRTMVGAKGQSDIAKAVSTINGIMKGSHSCEINIPPNTKRVDQDGVVDSEEQLERLVDFAGDELFRVGKSFYSGVYEIEDMYIGSRTENQTGVNFHIVFNKIGNASGVEKINHKIVFFPTTEMVSGHEEIIDCHMNATIKAESVLQKFCNDADPEFPVDRPEGLCDYKPLVKAASELMCNNASIPWLQWDGNQCRVFDSGAECGVDQYLQGYSATGELECLDAVVASGPGDPRAAECGEDGKPFGKTVARFTDYCSVGTYAGGSFTGAQFDWTCAGLNGGPSVSCRAILSGPPGPTPGRCNPATNGQTVATPIPSCVSGVVRGVTHPNPNAVAWVCDGIGPGASNAICVEFSP